MKFLCGIRSTQFFATSLLICLLSMMACKSPLRAAPQAALENPQSDSEKFQYLLWIKQTVPNLFQEAAKYDISLMTLVEEQQKAKSLLNQIPSYRSLKAARKNLLTLKISSASKENHNVVLNAENINALKLELRQTADELGGNPDPAAALASGIRESLATLNGGSSQGLLTGAIQCCVETEKKTLGFKVASNEHKLKFLADNLPDVMPATFAATPHGLSSGATKTQVLNRIREMWNAENTILKNSSLQNFVQNADGTLPATAEEWKARLDALNNSEIAEMSTRAAVERRLETYVEKFSLKSISQISNRMVGWLKPLTGQTQSMTVQNIPTLVLREMPPDIAIARGCTGGDCSTQRSFPYPNDPHERVFFVMATDDSLKGYVSTTTVEANGRKSLYVITVAGPRISENDTELILTGLDSAKGAMGVEQVLLPATVENLIGYAAIKTAYATHSTSTHLEVHYQNPEIRSALENFESDLNDGGYDAMEANADAVLFDAGKVKVSAEVTTGPMLVPQAMEMAHTDILQFAFDLHSGGHDSDVPRILNLGGYSRAQWKVMLSEFSNPQKLSAGDFEERIKEVTGLGSDFVKNHRIQMMSGYINAPQLPDDFATVSDQLLSLYLKDSAAAEKVLIQNSRFLLSYPPFQASLRKWLEVNIAEYSDFEGLSRVIAMDTTWYKLWMARLSDPASSTAGSVEHVMMLEMLSEIKFLTVDQETVTVVANAARAMQHPEMLRPLIGFRQQITANDTLQGVVLDFLKQEQIRGWLVRLLNEKNARDCFHALLQSEDTMHASEVFENIFGISDEVTRIMIQEADGVSGGMRVIAGHFFAQPLKNQDLILSVVRMMPQNPDAVLALMGADITDSSLRARVVREVLRPANFAHEDSSVNVENLKLAKILVSKLATKVAGDEGAMLQSIDDRIEKYVVVRGLLATPVSQNTKLLPEQADALFAPALAWYRAADFARTGTGNCAQGLEQKFLPR